MRKPNIYLVIRFEDVFTALECCIWLQHMGYNVYNQKLDDRNIKRMLQILILYKYLLISTKYNEVTVCSFKLDEVNTEKYKVIYVNNMDDLYNIINSIKDNK